jgi:hypothetical protein
MKRECNQDRELVVHDDALDLFDALMRTAYSQATREGQQERLRTIHDLDAAAQVLSEACQIVLDETQDPATLRERIYARVSSEHLQTAVTTGFRATRHFCTSRMKQTG